MPSILPLLSKGRLTQTRFKSSCFLPAEDLSSKSSSDCYKERRSRTMGSSVPSPKPRHTVQAIPPDKDYKPAEPEAYTTETGLKKKLKRGKVGSRVAMRIPRYGNNSGANVPT